MYLKNRQEIIKEKEREYEEKRKIIKTRFFRDVVMEILDQYQLKIGLGYEVKKNYDYLKIVKISLGSSKYSLSIEPIRPRKNIKELNTLLILSCNKKEEKVEINAITETPEKFEETLNNLFSNLDEQFIDKSFQLPNSSFIVTNV